MRILLALVFTVAGCSAAAPAATPQPTADPTRITKAAYGADWPFTADSGALLCVESKGRPLVTFRAPDGIEYALNGAAIDFGFPELDDTILVDYPDTTGVLPLIDQALEDC